jgi:5-methylcytosine-specific restriction protein A
LFLDPANHQSLCKRCHDRKTRLEDGGFGARQAAAFYPSDLRPAACVLTLVCGPPASGKSTYVKERAAARDVVIDLDELVAEQSGLPIYTGKAEHIRAAIATRNDMLRELATLPPQSRAWFVISAPLKRRAWWTRMLEPAQVVLLSVPMDECLRRIAKDPRRGTVQREHEQAVREWFGAEFGYGAKPAPRA